jgi:hypothetical protein
MDSVARLTYIVASHKKYNILKDLNKIIEKKLMSEQYLKLNFYRVGLFTSHRSRIYNIDMMQITEKLRIKSNQLN